MAATKQNTHDHERLVESYLLEHPWSTVVDIREGIASESGIQIERVQARIDAIKKRRVLDTDQAAHGRVAYRVGRVRTKSKALGVEARITIIDGAVSLDVSTQKADVEDPELARFVGSLRAILERGLAKKGVPLVERVAARLGLLGEEDEGAEWDDWRGDPVDTDDEEEGDDEGEGDDE